MPRPSTESQRRLLVRYGRVAHPGHETADPDAVVLDSRVFVSQVKCQNCPSFSVLTEDGEESCLACGRGRN